MEKTLEMEFLLHYPAIIPVDEKMTHFEGYIFVKDVSYPIDLRIVEYKNKQKFELKFSQKLEPFRNEMILFLTTIDLSHPVQVLNKLVDLIKQQSTSKVTKINTDIYRQVISEYIELKNFYMNINFSKISDNLSQITLTNLDMSKRTHELIIQVNYIENEKLFSICSYDLPQEHFKPDNSLIHLYETFIAAINKYDEFFNLMEEIDTQCWILDPEHPQRKDAYRRIGLNKNLSIVVTINPINVREFPIINFLGPKSITKDLAEKKETNMLNWDMKSDVMGELLKLLDLNSFPRKPMTDKEENILLVNVGECCICFSLRLNAKLPEIICQNTSCNNFFHVECLYQWLYSTNSRNCYLQNLFGQCPNCENSIRCPIPNTN